MKGESPLVGVMFEGEMVREPCETYAVGPEHLKDRFVTRVRPGFGFLRLGNLFGPGFSAEKPRGQKKMGGAGKRKAHENPNEWLLLF